MRRGRCITSSAEGSKVATSSETVPTETGLSKEIVIPATRVAARSVLSYWAVYELGLATTEVAKKLELTGC